MIANTAIASACQKCCGLGAVLNQSTILTRILREFFSNLGNVLTGGWPVRIARITVKYQRTGFKLSFESLPAELNSLLVVVWTYNFEIHVGSSVSSCSSNSPFGSPKQFEAINGSARLISGSSDNARRRP